MDGKICVITGATGGIGLETARELARRGAEIAIIGRNPDKGAKAIADLRKTAKHPDRLAFFKADLASLGAVRTAADAISARYARVDVLINNAGVINTKRVVTVDGFEETFAVNHLAHFALTGHLLGLLKAAPAARIVNVSSGAHYPVTLDFDDLQSEKSFKAFQVYGRTKLANIYFTTELARRMAGTGITANALHPGFVRSGFASNNGALSGIIMKLALPFTISPQKGAETSIYLASSSEVAETSGAYFHKSKPHKPSKAANDADAARHLWTASEEMTDFPFRELLPESVLGR